MKIKISLIFIFIISLFVFNGVEAKTTAFTYDDEVIISDKYEGATFALGNDVDITDEATVDGILFTAGDKLSISGIDEYLITLGNNIKMDENESKDAFIVGYTIETNNIKTSRDLYLVGNKIIFNGEVDRNIYIIGGSTKLSGTINGDVHILAPSIEIEDGTIITGKLIVPQDIKIKSNKKYDVHYYKIKTNDKSFVSKLINTIISAVNILIVGCVLFFVFKKTSNKISNIDFNIKSILTNTLIGVVSILISAICIVLLSVLMISKVCTVISIIGILFILFMIYSSSIFSSYYLSNKILGNKINNKYVLLTIGLLLTYLIRLIPYVGNIIYAIICLLGIGISIKILFKKES